MSMLLSYLFIILKHYNLFLDLSNEEFSIGRADTNSVILKENDLPYNILCRVSKVHFKITRKNCELSNPVIIKDCSRNGTFLNAKKIGFNEQRILQNDDVISLSHPNYKGKLIWMFWK